MQILGNFRRHFVNLWKDWDQNAIWKSLMAFFVIVGKFNLSVGLLYKSGLGLILFEFEKGVVFEFLAGLSENVRLNAMGRYRLRGWAWNELSVFQIGLAL